jgi:hypothetical protein
MLFRTLMTFSLGMATLAGICAFVIAYERASRQCYPKEARRIAIRAVPGPFLFFTCLGAVLGVAVPTFIHP